MAPVVSERSRGTAIIGEIHSAGACESDGVRGGETVIAESVVARTSRKGKGVGDGTQRLVGSIEQNAIVYSNAATRHEASSRITGAAGSKRRVIVSEGGVALAIFDDADAPVPLMAPFKTRLF